MRGATSRTKRSRLPFICSGRLPGGTAQVTRSVTVFAHEGCQLLHAVVDIADHPCLRDAGFPRVARNAAGGALVLVEAAIDLTAIALGGAHGRPVALGVVGHEAGADDADAIKVGIAAGRLMAG